MNRNDDVSTRQSYDRRDFLKAAAKGLVAISVAAAGSAAFVTAAPYVPELSNGADNFYRSNVVDVQRVVFKNQYGMRVAGNLFTPKALDRKTRHPALVVGHPMGAVKEQSANLYATKMAERGFVTLSLDLSFWGGSEGTPRNAVSPDIYAEDFSAAVDFLGTRAFVDRERIGAIGICGSGSFVISAAKIDPRMKAIATVSMYDMGAANRNGLKKSQTLEQRKHTISEAADQRYIEFTGGQTKYTSGTVHEINARLERHRTRVLRLLPHATRRGDAARPVTALHDAPDADQQREVHELLPVRRHRDDRAPSPALHHRRHSAFEGVQRGRLQAGGRAEGVVCRARRGPRGPLRSGETDSLGQARVVLQHAPVARACGVNAQRTWSAVTTSANDVTMKGTLLALSTAASVWPTQASSDQVVLTVARGSSCVQR